MFNHSNNARIKNSTLSITNNIYNGSSASSSLDLLYKSVAPNAILNAGGRADEVRCHPGTRQEVIGLVEASIAQEHSGPRMLWLSGPAGAGKTAIMQSVAERCKERGIPHANFFFFRADSSRRDASSLVATFMHQIIQLYPSIARPVAASLESDPLFFQMDLRKQFDTVMHEIFPAIEHSLSTCQPLALLIDGLDECDCENKTEQRHLLQALDTLLVQKGQYFRVVVASRVEPQISMTFKQLHSQVDSIFLDDQYAPEKDIRLFVTAEFDKIKSTHCLAHTLGPDWPSASDINGIVLKSSGQFIYASTVMRYIAYSPSSPILSLQKVQGIVPPFKNTPFTHLDAVYAYILEQVDDQDAAKSIFALKLLGVDHLSEIKTILGAYQSRYTEIVLSSCISELTPIVDGRHNFLKFFHECLADFLQDKSRAGDYHIDLEAFCTSIFPVLWASQKAIEVYFFAKHALRRVQRPTSGITAALMNAHTCLSTLANDFMAFNTRSPVQDLVEDLYRLYAPHDPQSFSKIIHKWTSDAEGLAQPVLQYLKDFPLSKSDFRILSVGDEGGPTHTEYLKTVEKGPRRPTGKGQR